jgi:hypothetical protein
MTAELEVVVHTALISEEALCMSRRPEPLHLPFSPTGWLV